MEIRTLQIHNLRNLRQVEIRPHSTLNTLSGLNGAGKTGVLESIAVLSRGRSFRGSQVRELIGPEGDSFRVVAELGESPDEAGGAGRTTRQGLERGAHSWQARKDGRNLSQLSELAESLPVVVMEPNSHLLISGSPEVRRRYLDWGVFHVEHRYLGDWRRYSRALKQRNAALRDGNREVLDSLDAVLAELGEAMTRMRRDYSRAVAAHLEALLPELSSGLGEVSVEYRQGWPAGSLLDALRAHRQRDLERDSTQYGPHRADLNIAVDGRSIRYTMSRGEQKLLAAALVLAQARRQSETGRIPVLLLDDLGTEFDHHHFASVLGVAQGLRAQCWISGVEPLTLAFPHSRFHVEHGRVRMMV